MGPMNDFNLQTFLSEMRDEQNRKIDALAADVKTVLDAKSDHETRITLLERFRSYQVKATLVAFAALCGFVFDIVKNHLFTAK
jgi:hypothetical protein